MATVSDIVVCWKVVRDGRWTGVSSADEAALEVALTIADQDGGAVTVVGLGTADIDDTLRHAAAVGAHRLVRVDGSAETTSAYVARQLGAVIATQRPLVVICGDYSVDRGSGSVPAFLAAEIGSAQALGLVGIDASALATTGTLQAQRRLDGGRREILAVPTPCVVSVEGAVASLRRAGLPAMRSTRHTPVHVVAGASAPVVAPAATRPYRPRARVSPAPDGDTLDRVRALLGVSGPGPTHRESVELDPSAAADRLITQLAEWGYLRAD